MGAHVNIYRDREPDPKCRRYLLTSDPERAKEVLGCDHVYAMGINLCRWCQDEFGGPEGVMYRSYGEMMMGLMSLGWLPDARIIQRAGMVMVSHIVMARYGCDHPKPGDGIHG